MTALAVVRYCNDGNDGYPSNYSEENKENFRYAFNESLKYTSETYALRWANYYMVCLVGRYKSEVFIGDPTGGDSHPDVWVLKGYTDDGDEIWIIGR